MPDTPQRSIAGRYRLVSLIGQGGMGRVWLARDETLRRDVAIKELVSPPGLTDDERRELRERSMREARAIARLDQSNVVRIFDVLHADGEPWIVMEFVPSRSLQTVLAESGPLPPAQVARIGLAVLAALRAAHQAGLLHRDVKPANVLIGENGRVKLTDFGLATTPDDPSMTRTGIVLGSPSYLAPERLTDGETGPAADLWSLGATLYAAVEGQPPYARSSSIATLTALATAEPTPPQRAGALTPALEGLLRKDPRQRIDVEEAERLLRQATTEHPAPAATPPSAAGAATVTTPVGIPAGWGPGQEPTQQTPGSTTARPGDPVTAPIAAASTVGVPSTASTATVATAITSTAAAPAAVAVAAAVAAKRKRRLMVAVATVAAVVLVGVVAVPPLIGNVLADDATDGPVAGTSTSPTPAAMAGWHYYTDSPGFSVPVPDGWQQLRDGTRVEFHELDSRRVLAVDALGTPKADLLTQAKAAEAADRKTGRYPGYEPLHLHSVNYRARAVEREWAYAHPSGTRMRALSRTFVAAENGQTYAIEWTTPDAGWAAGESALALVLDGFRAQRPTASPAPTSASARPTRSSTPSPRVTVTPQRTPRPANSRTSAPPGFSDRLIVNNANGKCIDVPGGFPDSPHPIQAWDCQGVVGQRFTLAADRTLRALGRCLETTGTDSGAKLRIAACTGSIRQQFILNKWGDLVALNPVKCVEVPGGSPDNGTHLRLWDCNSTPSQSWRTA
ncbi:protein kinase domain-containing protein [Micromonospora sp. DT233]|uniref:protein kinase domain-containing protein n=1 Tax=Micromonospora sp. DT233 TaxID=3393432 RepID=UPI003CE832B6